MAQNEITTVLKLNLEGDATSKFETAAASAKKFTSSTDRLIKNLELERIALEKGKDAMLLHKAAMEGATLDQLAHIKSTQAAIQAKKQEALASMEAANSEDYLSNEKQQGKTATDRLIQSLQIQEKEMREGRTAALVYRAALDGATKEQQDLIAQLHRSVTAQNASNQAMGAGARQARYMRGMTGQLGHQIQDVAVQMQMGTNGLLVFAQQGSQIASLMGPSGPLIGAILAVGAAIAVFYSSTKDAKDELKALDDRIRETAKSTGELTAELREYLAVEYEKQILKQENALRSLQDQETDRAKAARNNAKAQQLLTDDMAKYNGFMAQTVVGNTALFQVYGKNEEQLTELNQAERQHAQRIIETQNEIDRLKDKLSSLNNNENPEFAKKTSESTGSLEQFMSSLREKVQTLGFSARSMAVYNALQAAAKDGTLETVGATVQEINAIYDRIDAYNAEVEAKKQKEAADKKAADQERRDNEANMKALLRFQQEMNKGVENAQRDREALAKRNQDFKNYLADRVEGIRQSMLTEDQAYAESLQNRRSMLLTALQMEAISRQEYIMMNEALQRESIERQLNDQLRLIGGFEGMKQVGVDAISAIIKEGASMSDVFKMIGRSIVDNVIDSIVDMGIEFVKQKLIERQITAAASTAQIAQSVATGTAIAAAMAPAAAMTSLATMGANAVPAQAGIATTVGFAKAASLASFEGGGFTGVGSRSGGIDGKGGFPAILHPNETVIDHTKDQGQGITIVNNIDASGAGPEVDQKIVAAMEITSQQTVKQVQDLLRRQRLV